LREFRDEFKSESQYSGAPVGRRDMVIEWLRPRGGTLTDGARLAAINLALIVVAALVFFLLRALQHFFGLPFLFSGFFAALVLIGAAAWFWHRYAAAHGAAARERSRDRRPDLFGGVGALPFIFVGVLQTFNGALRLLYAMITFSAHRALGALTTLGVGIAFFALTVALIVIARDAVD
jgi:hypothetical protein